MEDKTKIDELFKQGLGEFSAEPPVDTWQNIQDNLMAARRRKKMAFWRISGTAAALVLAFFSGYFFNSTTQNMGSDSETMNPTFQFSTQGSAGEWDYGDSEQNRSLPNTVVETPVNDNVLSPEKNRLDREHNQNKNNVALLQPSKSDNLGEQKNTSSDKNSDLIPSSDEDNLVISLNNIALNPDERVEKSIDKNPAKAETTTGDTPATELAEAGEKSNTSPENNTNESPEDSDEPFVYEETKSSKKKKRYDTRGAFDLGAVASPTFAFNDVSTQPAQQTAGNANLGTSYSPSKEQSDELRNSYAAGLNLSYRTGARWEVSTGLHLNNWNQVSSDVFLTADTYTGTTTGGFTARGNTSTGPVTYNTGNNFFDMTKFENVGPNEYYLIPDIRQQYQFLEVPLRVGYYLFDSQKWSFKVQAGFSGRFLTHSDVKLVFEDGSTEDYDGLAVKDFSLQLVGGTGLSYKATKNLSINLTPSIQYGVTPVNKNSEIETYFHQFLVYTGLTYGF